MFFFKKLCITLFLRTITRAGLFKAAALFCHIDPNNLIVAKLPKIPLIHFSIAQIMLMDYCLVAYLHSQTSILKNYKSHNPTAQSGFISFSWLYFLHFLSFICYCYYYYEQIPLMFYQFCAPQKLLCWFVLYCVLLFFCKGISANVKVSWLLYQYSFSHHAAIICVPIQAIAAACNATLHHHKLNATSHLSHCLLLPPRLICP